MRLLIRSESLLCLDRKDTLLYHLQLWFVWRFVDGCEGFLYFAYNGGVDGAWDM